MMTFSVSHLSSVKVLFKALEKKHSKKVYTHLNVERGINKPSDEIPKNIFTLCQNTSVQHFNNPPKVQSKQGQKLKNIPIMFLASILPSLFKCTTARTF